MCDAIAHPVDRLRRTRIGAITDRGLRPGQMRDLTSGEVRLLMGEPVSPAPRTRRAKKR
jgi:16S rRNA U516 pseudouridylate synthase RsuA-like enzyme